jgi:hypothetical protein
MDMDRNKGWIGVFLDLAGQIVNLWFRLLAVWRFVFATGTLPGRCRGVRGFRIRKAAFRE